MGSTCLRQPLMEVYGQSAWICTTRICEQKDKARRKKEMDSRHDIGFCDDQWCLVNTGRKRSAGDALHFDVSTIYCCSTLVLERDADLHEWIDPMFARWQQWDLVGNERSGKPCGSIWIGKDYFGLRGVHLNFIDRLRSGPQVCILRLISLVFDVRKLFNDYYSYSTKQMNDTTLPFEHRYPSSI
jgi:hypothetical protein